MVESLSPAIAPGSIFYASIAADGGYRKRIWVLIADRFPTEPTMAHQVAPPDSLLAKAVLGLVPGQSATYTRRDGGVVWVRIERMYNPDCPRHPRPGAQPFEIGETHHPIDGGRLSSSPLRAEEHRERPAPRPGGPRAREDVGESRGTGRGEPAGVGEPPLPASPAAAVGAMWARILLAHIEHRILGRRGPLPGDSQPGCLYVAGTTNHQISAVLADSLELAWSELTVAELDPTRERAIWVPGDRKDVREASPLFATPASPLRAGRPILIRSQAEWAKAPAVAGIYRIHLAGDGYVQDRIYVGRSQNLARRPRRHEKLDGLPWNVGGGVRVVELIPAKPSNVAGVWTMTDLDSAEEFHIARARLRQELGGPVVLNQTVGRNGPPSRPPTHLFVWQPADPQSSGL